MVINIASFSSPKSCLGCEMRNIWFDFDWLVGCNVSFKVLFKIMQAVSIYLVDNIFCSVTTFCPQTSWHLVWVWVWPCWDTCVVSSRKKKTTRVLWCSSTLSIKCTCIVIFIGASFIWKLHFFFFFGVNCDNFMVQGAALFN